ncbi:MAG TPA: class II aldolase/adducin family protein [Gemmatimonadaceae bacterium]|nr:class II aldolase/adducin family protein [Gemmatimonadaceae bacterium]
MTGGVGEQALRRDIVRVCRRLYERGLIAGGEGNVSARLDDDSILITPSGASKTDVSEADLMIVDATGKPVAGSGRASSELGVHLRIYQLRRDVGAVVHAHPPFATALAVSGGDLMAPVLPEILVLIGGVPLVPYATPGSPALADAIEPFLQLHDAFLMANHGATSYGTTLSIAHQRMESLEHAAQILFSARALGHVSTLSDREREVLLELRRRASSSNESGAPKRYSDPE